MWNVSACVGVGRCLQSWGLPVAFQWKQILQSNQVYAVLFMKFYKRKE